MMRGGWLPMVGKQGQVSESNLCRTLSTNILNSAASADDAKGCYIATSL